MSDKKPLHESAYEDYKNGLKYKDIAEKYSVSLDTVKKWKTRHSWTKEDVHKKCTQKQKSVHKTECNETVEKALINSIEENEELTDKERFFCLYYLKNFNATQAAVNAGYTENYPSEIGYQLLQKTTVKKEIKRLKELKAQSILLTQDDIIERYMRIAFSDMTDFIVFGIEKEIVYSETGDVISERETNVFKIKDSKFVDGGLISQIKQGKDGLTIKLEDRQKALSWLGDYFMMNPMSKHKIEYDTKNLGQREKELEFKKSLVSKDTDTEASKLDIIVDRLLNED